MSTNKLLEGYHRYLDLQVKAADQSDQVSKPLRPMAMWIGCSDARVIPEQILQTKPGELFVVRTIAGLVPPYGTGEDSVGAALEYALVELNVPLIILCGHTDCAGLQALSKPSDLARQPYLARWLEWARPAFARIEATMPIEDQADLALVQANMLLQRDNVMSYPSVRDALAAGRLAIQAWIFDLLSHELFAYTSLQESWSTLSPPVTSD